MLTYETGIPLDIVIPSVVLPMLILLCVGVIMLITMLLIRKKYRTKEVEMSQLRNILIREKAVKKGNKMGKHIRTYIYC